MSIIPMVYGRGGIMPSIINKINVGILHPSLLRTQVINALFGASEQGALYDPSDLTTLYQDAAGTTPVTSDGDPVGKVLDLSGNGNHATQAAAAARPLYKTDGTLHWLLFDGVDDYLQTGSIDLTAAAEFSGFIGLSTLTPISTNSPVWAFGSASDTGAAQLRSGDGSVDSIRVSLYGSSLNQTTRLAQSSPYTSVFTVLLDVAATGADEIELRQDGSVVDTGSATDSGLAAFGNHPVTLGARELTDRNFFGKMYGLIFRGAGSTSAEVDQAEQWLNEKAGL